MTPDRLHKKAVEAFQNKPFSEAIDAVIAVVLEEAADAVGEVGDHADLGSYINAVRALVKEDKV